MANARDTGLEGEDFAVRFLKSKGYRIIERNFRTRYGEIDIVARRKAEIVFLEVKTRSSDSFGVPQEAVDRRKLSKISTVASHFIQKKGLENFSIKFEIVAIKKKDNHWQCEIIPVD